MSVNDEHRALGLVVAQMPGRCRQMPPHCVEHREKTTLGDIRQSNQSEKGLARRKNMMPLEWL